MEKKDQLAAYFKERGMTQESIARRFGVSQAYINSLLTGRTSFGKRQAQKWHEEFGFSTSWLLTGEGEMFGNHDEDNSPWMKLVPIIPDAAFAGPIQAISEGVMPEECQMVPSPFQKAEFALKVSGKSMEPKFPEGCQVFIRKIDDRMFIPWGYTHVLDTVNGAFIKNIYPIKGNKEYFEARSINPEFPPFEMPFRGVYGFYQVLGMVMGYGVQ